MISASAFQTGYEPLPTWCGPLLRALIRSQPEHSAAGVAQAIREAMVLKQDYHVATSLEALATRLLAGR